MAFRGKGSVQQPGQPLPPGQPPIPSGEGRAKSIDATARHAKNRKVIQLVLYFVIPFALIGLGILGVRGQQKEIMVIQITHDMLMDDIITEADIVAYPMLEVTYNTLGRQTFMSDGKQVTKQIMLKWSDRERILDKRMVSYTQAGIILTERHITDTAAVSNPHLASIPAGNEIYTLPFDSKGVNTNLLMPGSAIRVRLVAQVKNTAKQQVEDSLIDKDAGAVVTDVEDSGGFGQLTETTEPQVDADGNEIIPEGGETEAAVGGGSVILDLGADVLSSSYDTGTSTTPIAEVVFEKVTIIDMLNSSNESIFDVYIALLRMPISERQAYLKTEIENPNTSFMKRVLPSALILSLTREQATQMAEFEELQGATIKYTILPHQGEDELMAQFFEISEQINTFLRDTPGSSLQ